MEELKESQKVTHLVRSPLNFFMDSLGSFTCGAITCRDVGWGIDGAVEDEDAMLVGMAATGGMVDNGSLYVVSEGIPLNVTSGGVERGGKAMVGGSVQDGSVDTAVVVDAME